MTSTYVGELPIDSLPKEARQAHIFEALGKTSLLSLGQLCDHGCKALFDKDTCVITREHTVILQGHRNQHTRGLWIMSLPDSQVALTTIKHSAKPADLVAFAHAALYSPALSTLTQALERGYLPAFPGLTTESLKKYPPRSIATAMGHMDNTRKNTQSTKPSTKPKDELEHPKPHSPRALEEVLDDALQDAFPTQIQSGERTNAAFIATFDQKQLISTDQTGRVVALRFLNGCMWMELAS